MKNFLEMIEVVKSKGILYFDAKTVPSPKVDPKHFYEMVEKCQNFVFSLPKETTEAPHLFDEKGEQVYKALDAPFGIFSIENLGGDITVPTIHDALPDGRAWIHCILAYELDPKVYAYYVYGTLHIKGYSPNKVVFSTRALDAIVEKYIERINQQETGVEHVREKVKIGTGSAKRHHTIRRIIHIRPKSDKIDYSPITRRNIEWSHAWFVRGHWRKSPGLGKDREGNYRVEGFTWVTEHQKGEGVLIPKVRFIEP